MLQKTSAFKTKISAAVDLPPVICPDGSQCLPGRTCCRLPVGGYGCCPVPHTVGCRVGLHLCPAGRNCDATSSVCFRGSQNIAMSQKVTVTKKRICPDRTECAFSQTCCRSIEGGYDCCPHPNAVCCSDRIHCCRQGRICIYFFGSIKCRRQIPGMAMFKDVPATKKRAFYSASDDTVCPQKKYQCPKESICCKLSSGPYGCCPLKNAVCCDDHKHCCPEGYTCDVEAG